ncbi:hypothetical protein ACIGEP_08595 [Microbacterium sp. NPDC077663]|uniref:hypothetical protein n=1 Tax=Microbacterium sp. NPDC077663 TaxID=3364189 RepID=UPI0037CAAB82
MTVRPARTRGAARIALAAAVTAVLIGSLTAAPANAVSKDPKLFCDLPGQRLAISPISGLKDGQKVTWRSTVKGTTPTTFTGEYVGKLENGLGTDANGKPRDLLLVKLEGDVVDGADGSLAAGVWAGASGSPVYDADGALIGAVSYGFSALPDNVAGVTPAAYMKSIGTLPTTKKLSASQTQKVQGLADESSSSRRSAPSSSTLNRIEPVRVTIGASAQQLDDQTDALADRVAGFRGVTASGRAVPGGERRSSDYPIVAGGNIAVSYGYGAITEASVGTVTAVCGTEVFAYGHPNMGNSKLAANIHGASAARIVPDLMGSYKLVSAIGKVKGKLVDDRLAGVRGVLGAGATTIPLRTSSAVGDTRTAVSTQVSEPDFLATAAYVQLAGEAVRMLDNVQEGSAYAQWTIEFRRANGKVGTITNANRYSDVYDLPGMVGMGLAEDIAKLQANPFEDIRILSVNVVSRFDPDHRVARLSGVQMRKNGAWVNVKPDSILKVSRGSSTSFRTVLSPVPGSKRVTTYDTFTVTMPKDVKKLYKVTLTAPYSEDEYQESRARNFAEFLTEVDANFRSDVLEREAWYMPTSGPRRTRVVDDVVSTALVADGASFTFQLEAPTAAR